MWRSTGSFTNSRGKSHTNEDSAKGIILSIHSNWRANLQITERVQTTYVFSVSLPRHIAKVRALKEMMMIKSPSNQELGMRIIC